MDHDPPLTYEAAAELCGLQGPWNIQDIERGKSTDPQASTLAALSDGLGISLQKLIVAIQKDKNGETPPSYDASNDTPPTPPPTDPTV